IPVLDFEPGSEKEPVLLSKPQDRRWSFSFRYWKQVEFFGLDQTDSKWFVSLLEKLRELCGKKVEDFISNEGEKGSWRYHKINWNQKNIPIQRGDLEWVDKVYRDNPDDYPLLQFQVSTALGRVVGFGMKIMYSTLYY
ncbi:hypothetical protein, partial [Vibrio anguillarum]